MSQYRAWPLTTSEGVKWIVEEVIAPSVYKPVKECDTQEEALGWMAGRRTKDAGNTTE